MFMGRYTGFIGYGTRMDRNGRNVNMLMGRNIGSISGGTGMGIN
jgi:hypothetical protein